MPSYTQANRPIAVATPLGPDVLLLDAFGGAEAISEPFRYELSMLAPLETAIAFDKLLGQKCTVSVLMDDASKRFFCGYVKSFSQGPQVARGDGEPTFIRYRAELVPEIYFLVHKFNSRIFQQKTVIDILKLVFTGMTVTYSTQGDFKPRDYCVQYRESDFSFASRLMEEEGIYYFFKHADNKVEMVLANTPQGHPSISGPAEVQFHEQTAGIWEEDHVITWEKTQEIRSNKTEFRDYCFEMPDKDLKVTMDALATVQIGAESHKLKVTANEKWEIYDFPGEYAQRFDGIAPAGAEQASKLQDIFPDGKRTVEIRRQADTMQSVAIMGEGSVRQFITGHKFKLAGHFSADGEYVLTRIEHTARLDGAFVSNSDASLIYRNRFSCIPAALPYRPIRKTKKARVDGTHTAVVVGPQGEEIFTDKYGRIKIQFHWDRDGKKDANSSCWVRVGTPWAGQQWGMIHIPRIGQEVIVDFLEGDPDQPIVIGSVYNAAQMPPYLLPDKRTQSGLKTHSTLKGDAKTFNELRFEDKKASEDIYFHAQKDFHRVVEHDDDELIQNNQLVCITGVQTVIITGKPADVAHEGKFDGDYGDAKSAFTMGAKPLQPTAMKLTINKGDRDELMEEGKYVLMMNKGDRIETLQKGNDSLTLAAGNRVIVMNKGSESFTMDKGNRVHILKAGDDSLTIEDGSRGTAIKKDDALKIEGGQTVNITKDQVVEIASGNSKYTVKTGNMDTKVSAGNITIKASAGKIDIEAAQSITLKCGGSVIKMSPTGISMEAVMIKIVGKAMLNAKAPITQIKGDGMVIVKGGITMIN